jgi:hypothetical protein
VLRILLWLLKIHLLKEKSFENRLRSHVDNKLLQKYATLQQGEGELITCTILSRPR